MAVFSLQCSKRGSPVEIPGRFGFKLKSAGGTAVQCTRCRQGHFIATRREGMTPTTHEADVAQQRRMIPLAAVLLAALLLGAGEMYRSWGVGPNPIQDRAPASESPSK